MARYATSPDELGAVAALTLPDGESMWFAARQVSAAGREACAGVGAAHPALLAAAEHLFHLEPVVLGALADAAAILSAGFAGAAEQYRDADARVDALMRRELDR